MNAVSWSFHYENEAKSRVEHHCPDGSVSNNTWAEYHEDDEKEYPDGSVLSLYKKVYWHCGHCGEVIPDIGAYPAQLTLSMGLWNPVRIEVLEDEN